MSFPVPIPWTVQKWCQESRRYGMVSVWMWKPTSSRPPLPLCKSDQMLRGIGIEIDDLILEPLSGSRSRTGTRKRNLTG